MKRPWQGPLILVGMVVFAVLVFPSLPARIPTHWGLSGEPDRWTARWPGAFVLPIIALSAWLLLRVVPRIDPRGENYDEFRQTYWIFLNYTTLFFALLQVFSYGTALGWPIGMERGIFVAIGVLFVMVGNVLPRLRSNSWIGIRTPWTLESDAVWRSTHRLGGRTFVAAGFLVLIGAFAAPRYLSWPIMWGSLGLAVVVPGVHSYLAWRRERESAAA